RRICNSGVMRQIHIERHLTFEVERVFHKNRVHSSVSRFFREIDCTLCRFNASAGKQHHGRWNPFACGFDELQLFGVFQINGLAVGPEDKVTFDAGLDVLLDILLETVVTNGPTLIEGGDHWRNYASKIKQRVNPPFVKIYPNLEDCLRERAIQASL